MKLSNNKIIIAAFSTLMVLAISYVVYVKFFYNKNKDKQLKPLTVEAQNVRRGGILQRITIPGALLANESVELRPQVRGKIKTILFTPGTHVEAGDPLIQLEDEGFKAKVKEAEAKFLFEKAEYARYSTLATQNAGPGRKKEESYSKMLQADANWELAKLELQHSLIKAPFEGIVGLKNISVGEYVTDQNPILSIVDIDPIKIEFKVPEKYIRNISIGQNVDVIVDGFGDEVFKAKIDSIDAKADPNAHSINVHGVMDNKSGLLKPGLFARTKLEVGHKEDVLLIPKNAVKIMGEEASVYKIVEVKTKEGKEITLAVKTTVVRGITEGSQVEIERGLKEDDKVVTVGQEKFNNHPEAEVRIVADIESADDDITNTTPPVPPVIPNTAPAANNVSKDKK